MRCSHDPASWTFAGSCKHPISVHGMGYCYMGRLVLDLPILGGWKAELTSVVVY